MFLNTSPLKIINVYFIMIILVDHYYTDPYKTFQGKKMVTENFNRSFVNRKRFLQNEKINNASFSLQYF